MSCLAWQSPSVNLKCQVGPFVEWLVEILPFAALTDGEKAKIFEGAASTSELGKMQLFHDAAGRTEYPHFFGRRVRLIVGLGRCEGSKPTGTSLGETQSTSSSTHDEMCERLKRMVYVVTSCRA